MGAQIALHGDYNAAPLKNGPTYWQQVSTTIVLLPELGNSFIGRV